MREDGGNWFSQWAEELPSPDELMPMSQSLITADLALAFDITPPPADGDGPPNSTTSRSGNTSSVGGAPPPPAGNNSGSDVVDSADIGGAAQEEAARTLKRPRLVWTPQLHKRFVDAVAHLGIKNAVPKTIMQLMSVEGLTRENVASHLQKYRLYLKRMQGISGGSPAGPVSPSDIADHHLFASSPLPHHFLHRGPPPPAGADHFLPSFVSLPPLQPAPATATAPSLQQPHHRHQISPAQLYNSRRHGQFGSPTGGYYDHGLLSRQPHPGDRPPATVTMTSYEDVDAMSGGGRKKVLTLFPTGND